MRLAQLINLKRLALPGLTSLGLLASLVVPAQTATAHYVYEEGFLYQSSTDCVWGRSEVSHGTGQGYSKSDISVKYQYNGTHCADHFTRPVGYIKARQIYQTHLAPGWSNCRDTGWIYNTRSASYMTVARTHNTTCGSAYSAHTVSYLYQHNGSWKGGSLLSGNHAVPF